MADINVNGTACSNVIVDGVEMAEAYMNGVLVWRRFQLLEAEQISASVAAGPQSAQISFNTDGSVSGAPATGITPWGDPIVAGIGADYEIYFSNLVLTQNGPGTYSTPTLNTWLSMASIRTTSTATTTSAQSQSVVVMDYSIRRITDPADIISSRVFCTSETLAI